MLTFACGESQFISETNRSRAHLSAVLLRVPL